MLLPPVFRAPIRSLQIILLILFLLSPPANIFAEETGPSGPYIEIGGQTDPAAIGVGLGAYNYNYRYLTTRLALYVLGSESVDDTFVGADAGFRMELGTPLSPFIGLGAYYGYHTEQISADNDGLDNNGDGQVDEGGEKDAQIDRSMATIYPEAGLHIWIDKNNRLTLSGKYHITTEGRDSDFWLFCFGIYFATH